MQGQGVWQKVLSISTLGARNANAETFIMPKYVKGATQIDGITHILHWRLQEKQVPCP